MSGKDDDFLDHGGDEFDANSDEFSIPEDPHQDDDFLEQTNDDFELHEDDVVDMSGGDVDQDLFGRDDALSLDEHQEFDEFGEAVGSAPANPEPESEQAYDEPEQGSAGLGWKAWVGLGLGVILVVAALKVFIVPMVTPGANAPQAREEFPEPPPAPSREPAPRDSRAAADQSLAGQNQSRGQQGQNAPVPVSPFPDENPSPMTNAPAPMEPAPAMTNPSTMPAPQPMNEAPTQMAQASQPVPPDQGTGYGAGGGGSNQPIAKPFTLDEAGDQDYRYETTSANPNVQEPQRYQPEREPQYMAALEQQRQAFQVLLNATQNNGQQLSDVKNRLDTFQRQTDRDVEDLDQRVDRLERLVKEGAQVKTQQQHDNEKKPAAQQATAESDRAKSTSYKVPKSPDEIKDLQRRLKAHNYRPGHIDGILGEQTRWAIKRLQQEHGLKVTGWLDGKTLKALEDPKHYSGDYAQPSESPQRSVANRSANPEEDRRAEALGRTWFVRGVTPTKAVVYRPDGLSFAVRVGSEIPGMGQVTRLDTEKIHVVTARGVITRR